MCFLNFDLSLLVLPRKWMDATCLFSELFKLKVTLQSPRLVWPQTKSGRETPPALNFWTFPAMRQFRPWTSPAANHETSPALRHFWPWDKSGQVKPWDISGPETCTALRHVRTSQAPRHFQPRDFFSKRNMILLSIRTFTYIWSHWQWRK